MPRPPNVTSAPKLAPFTWNCTPATARSALATAKMLTVPLTIRLPATDTVGPTVTSIDPAGVGNPAAWTDGDQRWIARLETKNADHETSRTEGARRNARILDMTRPCGR